MLTYKIISYLFPIDSWKHFTVRERGATPKVIKEKSDTLIKEMPIYVTQADTNHFGVNVGFVRHYNAAFSGEPAGHPTEFDRRPPGIPLAEIAEVNAFNANICWQWREQALGLKAFYQQLQQTHNAMP
ncbi:MAG: hypothetical protein ON057_000469 [Glomeribacter sp. 1016415]|nr:hypothetical protein [Glomeribacter sp. 1016415]